MDMEMGSAVPEWLTPVAWTYIAFALLSTAAIAADVYLSGRRHRSVASELVWVSSGLYLGPFAYPVYRSRGRANGTPNGTPAATDAHVAGASDDVALAVLPGGGASAVAHLIAVPFVAAVGWTIAGMAMWPMIIVIAILVTVMLAVYERTASVRAGTTRHLTIGTALFAAVVTVVAFDIGMVGWMLLLDLNNAMPAITESTFWFLMQVGVLIGLVTGYPAVKWLLRRDDLVAAA